jgi:hypothetical protein
MSEHTRESTTPLVAIGAFLVDCSCGAQFTVPFCRDEAAALDARLGEHAREANEIERLRAEAAATRGHVADALAAWLKDVEHAECFEDDELVAFIRGGTDDQV